MDTGMKKILAVVVVLALLTVGVAVGEHYKSDETNTNSFSLVARVNAEGSSVFVAESYLEELQAKGVVIRDYNDLSGVFYDLVDGVAVPNDKYAENWSGMVIGTPGNTSIQHKMIQQFVEKMSYNGEKMRFEKYEQGATAQPGVVYYDTTLTNLNIWNTSSHMDAGTIWQPVCGAIEASNDRPAVRIMSSAQMEPNHACCVIGAVDGYLASNEDTVVRFLAAYIESVTAVNKAIEAILYYGGTVAGISAIFSAIDEVNDYHINAVFRKDDVPDYQSFNYHKCPMCKAGQPIEALVNGFGYSKL